MTREEQVVEEQVEGVSEVEGAVDGEQQSQERYTTIEDINNAYTEFFGMGPESGHNLDELEAAEERLYSQMSQSQEQDNSATNPDEDETSSDNSEQFESENASATPPEKSREELLAEELERLRLDNIRLSQQQFTQQQQKISPNPPEEQLEEEQVKKPVRPKRPEVSYDPLDWSDEDKAAMKQYDNERDSYDDALSDYYEKLSERNLKTVESRLSKKEQAEQAQKEITEAEKRLWEDNRTLQSFVPELSTTKDIAEVHNDIVNFANNLAYSMGVDVNDMQLKNNLLYRYVNGDSSVVSKANAVGLSLSEDADKYFKISDLKAKKDQGVKAGLYGPNTSLKTVWLDTAASSGSLETAFRTSSVDPKVEQKRAAAEAVRQAEQAPRTMASQQSSRQGFDEYVGLEKHIDVLRKKGLSDNDIKFYLDVNTGQHDFMNPAISKRLADIEQKYGL